MRTTNTISKACHEIHSDVRPLWALRLIHSLSYYNGLIIAKRISCQLNKCTLVFTSVMDTVYTSASLNLNCRQSPMIGRCRQVICSANSCPVASSAARLGQSPSLLMSSNWLTLGTCTAGLWHLVCVSVCLSVTTVAVTSFISKQKTRYHRVLYGVFLDFDSRVSPKRLRSGAMAILPLSTIVAAFSW